MSFSALMEGHTYTMTTLKKHIAFDSRRRCTNIQSLRNFCIRPSYQLCLVKATRSSQKRTSSCRASATERAADELPAELKKIVTNFSMVPDAKLKYQQLLYLGKKLPPLPAADHTEENKVRGCVSQVWVVPRVKDGNVYWEADSDSLLTKGLAALLVQGLSGCRPEDIIRIQPEFLEQLGLGQALTPSRNNGFLNMFKLMQAKALQLLSG